MSMSITGLGSGFDIDSWVSSLVAVKKSSTVTPLESKLSTLQSKNSSLSNIKSKYSALQSSLKAFTDVMYNSSSDMWTNTSITSSNSDYVTASSSGVVSATNLDIRVESIATSTVASSYPSLSAGEDVGGVLFTKLANGQTKTGTFSLFLDEKRYEINIDKDDTIDSIITKIKNLGKAEESSPAIFDASLEDGIMTIKPKESSSTLVLGSSGDTSNIVSALKLYKKDETDNVFESAYPISKINTSVAIASAESGFGTLDLKGNENTGIIKINGVEFEINENTTLNDLISKINGNSKANVKASYDSLTNRFILTSTQTGASNIALDEENTNLFRILGLTDGTDGNEYLKKNSQELGKNAVVYIGENKILSNSNTITGESSGIANLSITIKKATTGKNDEPSSVSLDIEPDYSKVKSALKTFVNAYNDVVSTTKNAVSTGGSLAHDSSLNSILSTIKSITTSSSDNSGKYSVLSQIGITTSSSDPNKLEISDKKLEEALNNDFESVKLLFSDGYVAKGNNGLFDKMIQNVDNILNVDNGFFATKTSSLDSQIKLMNSRIERANTQLSKYETRITAQFNRMDSIMSQLSTQLSTFQSYIGG